MLAEGRTFDEIVATIGGTRNSVQKLAWQADRRVADRRIVLSRPMIDALQAEAARRGLSAIDLAQQLLETIIRDELFDPLLGEWEARDAQG
jgi:hypothetical protein